MTTADEQPSHKIKLQRQTDKATKYVWKNNKQKFSPLCKRQTQIVNYFHVQYVLFNVEIVLFGTERTLYYDPV